MEIHDRAESQTGLEKAEIPAQNLTMGFAEKKLVQESVIRAEILGRDFIEMKILSSGERVVHYVGCTEFSHQVLGLKQKYGPDPEHWEFSNLGNHWDLLLKEFILKCRGGWEVVYEAKELCHCRNVTTQTIEQAILCGARTTEEVSRWTSAGTACGTCRSHVEAILKVRFLSKR